ncbi:MAG: hypothetical protein KJO55_02080 [Gammaproteobacteria bacterium]|nr:hypothetical protein [Gammaproteobacteria bacterium]
MTDLIDRLGHEARNLGRWRIPVARFNSGLTLYALGSASAAQVATGFDLQGDELAQAQAVRTVLDGKTGMAAKFQYLEKLQAVVIRIADPNDTIFHDGGGNIDKAAVRTALEIP